QRQASRDLIDLHHPGLDALGIDHRLFQIARYDGGGKADIETVGELEGFFEIFDGQNCDHRPKDFFAGDAHFGSDVVEHCCLHEITVRQIAVCKALTAANQFSALFKRLFDVLK